MRASAILTPLIIALACLFTAAFAAESTSPGQPEQFDAAVCLGCHNDKNFQTTDAAGNVKSLYVAEDKFKKSVHGKRLCVECHKDITEIPHKKGVEHKVSCVKCHEDLWDAAKQQGKTQENERLGVVVQQIERYMKSIHARPSIEDQSRTNATCYSCHDAHYVYPKGSDERTEWRLSIPNVCGKCHAGEREEYATSVHGEEVLKNGNPYAAICSDCHTTHDVESPQMESTRLTITKNCGNCHTENLKSYMGTYHGQVNTLGYAYTAKCFDCHGSHGIKRVNDPESTVFPTNRLRTCRQCHMGATAGFATFMPHGNTHDFSRYPYMWIASKFMIALLISVFAFFWAHSALWFYREYRERKTGEHRRHIVTEKLDIPHGKHFRRFGPIFRLAHLIFAISVMMLVLTGMSVFYAESDWAKAIMRALGGPRMAGILHRISAAVMLGLFFMHLVWLVVTLGPKWRTFQWLGPNSMVPNLQDVRNATGMFKWFFGRGPRPVFDRWTYWEKFDYWAVFWGMGVIGGSGLMLALPNLTASIFPGWIFNIATIVHGEEAFLAAVFLFTVHFFNNHLRPDKFPPPDIVMFTGTVDLEEFRREHGAQYQRLIESGELDKYLVDAPPRQMTLGSKILGSVLLLFGLTLLVLVLVGFIGEAT